LTPVSFQQKNSFEMKARLLAEQVKMLYWQSELIVIFSPFVAVSMVATQWNTANHNLLLAWLGAHILHAFIWNAFRQNYMKHSERRGYQLWVRKQHIILMIMGPAVALLYGLSVPLFWNEHEIESVMMICLILTALNIAPFIGNAISFPVYFWSPILSMGPIAIYAMLMGGYFWWLSILAIMGIVAFLLYARRLSQTFNENFYLRFQNEALAQSLRQEKELVEKSSRAKTRFLASASHDLRQPLQAQRLYVESMIGHDNREEVDELARKVIDSQQAMQKMLDALLDLSKLDAGMMTPCFSDISLKHLFFRMNQAFSSVAENKGIDFHLHWPPDGASVRSDAGMLESILCNLISNAIRYTDEGAVMLAARRRGSHWRLEVRDSGKGIAKTEQQNIFEEFRQLDNPERDREKGLGLGLSIVRRLALLLEHDLSLLSRPGRGSVFAVCLPVGLFPMHEDLHHEEESQSDLSGYAILVIDDEFSIRDGMSCMLERYGCHVLQAADRKEAEAVVRQQKPDAMVVDYRLARDDNGIELIAHLHQYIDADIPALLLTGDTSPDVLQTIEQSGIPILHKPVASNTLLQLLAKLLEPVNTNLD
jgi:signal transduction histidine kinase/ActR/RegA family two-component response regulator